MFRADAARQIFTAVQTTGLAFDVEVLYLARRLGLQICEMPVEWLEQGHSVIRPFRDGLSMIHELMAILARKYHSPLAIPAETRQP
jgi:dolichyl-phosphate beta-glucosyltransferase